MAENKWGPRIAEVPFLLKLLRGSALGAKRKISSGNSGDAHPLVHTQEVTGSSRVGPISDSMTFVFVLRETWKPQELSVTESSTTSVFPNQRQHRELTTILSRATLCLHDMRFYGAEKGRMPVPQIGTFGETA